MMKFTLLDPFFETDFYHEIKSRHPIRMTVNDIVRYYRQVVVKVYEKIKKEKSCFSWMQISRDEETVETSVHPSSSSSVVFCSMHL